MRTTVPSFHPVHEALSKQWAKSTYQPPPGRSRQSQPGFPPDLPTPLHEPGSWAPRRCTIVGFRSILRNIDDSSPGDRLPFRFSKCNDRKYGQQHCANQQNAPHPCAYLFHLRIPPIVLLRHDGLCLQNSGHSLRCMFAWLPPESQVLPVRVQAGKGLSFMDKNPIVSFGTFYTCYHASSQISTINIVLSL